MMVFICTKVNENILMGIRVMERAQKVNRRTSEQTDGGHDIIRPVFYRRIKNISPRSAFMRKNSLFEGQL